MKTKDAFMQIQEQQFNDQQDSLREQMQQNYADLALRRSLYNIQQDYMRLMADIEDNEGELTPEMDSFLTFTLNNLTEKAVSYGYCIKHFDNEIDSVYKEIERLKKIAEIKEKIQDKLKEKISFAMRQFGIEKVTNNNLTLSFRKSSQVVINDDAILPKEYIRVKVTESPDKTLLKSVLQEGKEIDGVYLLDNYNLQIK